MQTAITSKSIAQVGEAITHELGAQMVTDFQAANPTDVKSFQLGRNIIEEILAQPGCAGMRFYNAYNEMGDKTLVYVGIDAAGNSIIKYTLVDSNGSFDTKKGIVADRLGSQSGNSDTDLYEWLTNAM